MDRSDGTNVEVKDGAKSVEERSASHIGRTYKTTVAQSSVTGTTIVTGESEAKFFPASELEPERPAPPLEQLFPQWEDRDVDEAAVVYRIRQAHSDLEKVALLDSGDEMEAANLRTLAESSLFAALQRAEFNPSLYSALSFCAWSLRNANPVSVERPVKLAALVGALLELRENPFLDYSRSAEIIEDLRESGWEGDPPAAIAFRQAMEADDGGEFVLGR